MNGRNLPLLLPHCPTGSNFAAPSPWRFAAAFAFALLSACGGDSSAATSGDEYEAELFEHTKPLTKESLAALTEPVHAADTTLRFDPIPAEVEALERGDVLISTSAPNAPDGLLRLVTKVRTEAGALVVETMQAPLQLAFRRLHLKIERDVMAADAEGSAKQHISDTKSFDSDFDVFAFNGDGDATTDDDQVRAQGHLEGGFHYDLEIDLDWGSLQDTIDEATTCVLTLFTSCDPASTLPSVDLTFDASVFANTSLDFSGAAFSDYKHTESLGSLEPGLVEVGLVTFNPIIDVQARFEGEASSQFELSTKVGTSVNAGVEFSSFGTPKLHGPHFEPPEVEVERVAPVLSARGRVRVGPRLHLRLYNIFGPYLGVFAFAELSSDTDRDPCWNLTGGLEGEVGFSLVIPVPGLYINLGEWGRPFDLSEDALAEGACDLPPGGIVKPAQALADPAFTPWSEAATGGLWAFPFEGQGAQLEWLRLTPSVDGHTLLSGSATEALTKLDADGGAVWSRRYLLEDPWQDGPVSQRALLIDNALSTPDARLLVSGFPYTLARLDQAGHVQSAVRYDLPYRETWLRFSALALRHDGSQVATAAVSDDAQESLDADTWLLALDDTGESLWSKRIGDAGQGEIPRAMVAVGDDVVVVGSLFDPQDTFWRGFAMRVGADGAVRWARVLHVDDGGDEARSHLTSVVPARDGDLIVGGSVHGPTPGESVFVAKLLPEDGSLASHTITTSDDTWTGMTLTGVTALPTTGYLATGHYTRNEGGALGRELWLAGLDGAFHTQWLERYPREDDPLTTGQEESDYPAVRFTSDGGAWLAAYTESWDPDSPKPGLWVSKVHARDGFIEFADGTVSRQALSSHELPGLDVSLETWSPDVHDFDVDRNQVNVESRKATLDTTVLAP